MEKRNKKVKEMEKCACCKIRKRRCQRGKIDEIKKMEAREKIKLQEKEKKIKLRSDSHSTSWLLLL